jgi:hypothetical protein
MNRSNKEIILVSILACLWAVQAAVALTQVLGFWQAPQLINGLLIPEAAGRVVPKWDILIYVFFIAAALILGKMIFQFYKKPVNQWFLAFEAVVTFLMVSAVFKVLVYFNSPQLAQWSLTALIILSIAGKIFYPELKRSAAAIYQRLGLIAWAPYADVWWVAVIVLFIYMPDLERVISMIFLGECLHHFDFLIMSVGWASLWGQVPYVDVISQYGVGLPIIFAKLTHVFGGFEYVPVLRAMMWFVIVYFILTYFFVRYWLKSALIAGVAFLLIFRLQMFHYGVSPLIWCTASASPIRFGLDILWMAALLQHMRSGKSRWLVLAALYSGFAPYYMTSGGMCVMVTFYVYLLALIFLPSMSPVPSKRRAYYLCWVLPLVSALVFFGATFKAHILQKEFWHNLVDYMVVFSNRGAMPMFESLKYRHFWAFFMSMVLPFTYIATLLYISAGLYLEKKKDERVFTALLCIYGLANYQYYVVRSAVTSYYVDVLPFILIVCFWFMRCLDFMPLVWQRRLKAAAVALSFYALLTNQNYLAYPNLLNFSRNPMTDNLVIQRWPDRQGYFNNLFKKVKEEDKLPVNDLGNAQEDMRTEDDFKNDAALVDYYHDHFNFPEDAALIRRLTASGERVALISSFETKVLIQAGRAPFFYHFPLLTSRPMTFRTFPADAAEIPSFQSDTISELEGRRPMYVFMEKVFLQDQLPASYEEYNARLLAIIAYVRAHYQPVEQGKYLVAMKRKD